MLDSGTDLFFSLDDFQERIDKVAPNSVPVSNHPLDVVCLTDSLAEDGAFPAGWPVAAKRELTKRMIEIGWLFQQGQPVPAFVHTSEDGKRIFTRVPRRRRK